MLHFLTSINLARLPYLLVLGHILLGVGCGPGESSLAAPIASTIQVPLIPDRPVLIATAEPTAPSPPPPTPIATSTAVSDLPTPQPLQNSPDPEFISQAGDWQAELQVIDASNTGIWQFAAGTFLHPVAIEIVDNAAYLIDAGRVLAVDLTNPQPPLQLLAPGDLIENTQILEPLDLASLPGTLLVLDRAGDVYRYDIGTDQWTLDRYDRPAAASSGHYFVALTAEDRPAPDIPTGQVRALLETNYKFVQLYGGDTGSLWNLEERRGVDLRLSGGQVYVLQREMHDLAGVITLYKDTSHLSSFQPRFPIEQPRQLLTTPTELLTLDLAGRRLISMEPSTGKVTRLVQLPQDEPVTAVAYNPQDKGLIFAARDRLYFAGYPKQLAAVEPGDTLPGMQAHDSRFLAGLTDYVVPIGGSNITFRDFQMPGAPRHYRLGVHNGMDFYWQPGTTVQSVGDGIVVRADTGYVAPTAADLAAWAADSEQRGFTAPDILDKYMGRQVWIEHAPGIVSRYAHLRTIAPEITVGSSVARAQAIGEVGNSGSPASLESEQADAHLHFELWLGETHIGQFLRPIEARELIEQMFPTSR